MVIVHGYKGPVMPNYMKMMIRQRYNHIMLGAAESSCLELSSEVDDVESPKYATPSSTATPSPLSLASSCTASPHVSHNLQRNIRCVARYGGGDEPGVYQWWRHKAEDCLWLASAAFILYYGDFRSDFFTLLANDVRVLRIPLHIGLACLMVDVCVVMLYVTIASTSVQGMSNCYNANCVVQAPSVLQVAMVAIGSTAFILMCVALWPIWSFLTVPMLFTLLMAVTVVAPYMIVACTKVKVKLDLLEEDPTSRTRYSVIRASLSK